MSLKLGDLTFQPALNNPNLIAKPVENFLTNWVGSVPVDRFLVAEIDPEFSDSMEFCTKYKISPTQGANCLIVESKRGDEIKHAACLIPINKRADINGLVRRHLNGRQTSLASKEFAVSKTGMEYGSITIIGLPANWPVLIDRNLTQVPNLIIGGGLRRSKLLIPGQALSEIPNAVTLEGLSR